MKKNILKSNSSFVVIGKSPAWLQNNFESGRIFSLAQAVNFDFSSNRQASKQLGYQNYSSNIDYRTPEVNLSIDYYFSPSLNNELLMGFKESSGSNATSFSGFKNNNYNFYFFSNENEDADGFDEVKKPANIQNWSEGEVISFGNCYLTNYSLYDVLFLPDLVKKFLNKSPIYTKIIPEISHIVFQYKRNIQINNFSFNQITEIVNKYNIYFIKNLDKKFILNEIYQYHKFSICDKEWDNLIQITYFKNFFETLFKYLVYYNISKTQNIYIKKENIANKFKLFDLSAYPYINNIILRLNDKIIKYF